MADARQFAKLDLGYFDNPKTADFIDDHPHVLLLHLRAILYSRQHLTNGKFPVRLVARMASASYCGSQCDSECDYCRAVDAGLLERDNARTGVVHDYLLHQQSATDVERLSNAGKKGAAARWSSDSDADRNADRTPERNPKANAEREEREERENNVAGGEEFDLFWATYPRKIAKGQAVKAWRAAIKKANAATILAGLKAALPKWAQTDPKFIPHAATWLNGERWADETAVTADPDEALVAAIPTVEQLVEARDWGPTCDECERQGGGHFRGCSKAAS